MVIPTHIHIKKLEDGFDEDQLLERPGAGPGTGPIGHAEALENSSVGQFHILLNAYMRSGSTYTGRLLCRQVDTFSFTEPFWKFFVYGYLTADNDFCDTRRPQCRYSRLSLSRSRSDPLKHFEISVLRHTRCLELRKIQIAQLNFTNEYVIRLL